jgi:hypothetical protein
VGPRLNTTGLDDQGSISGRGNDGIFSLRHRIQICSGAHSASYTVGIGDKSAEAWSWPLTSI